MRTPTTILTILPLLLTTVLALPQTTEPPTTTTVASPTCTTGTAETIASGSWVVTFATVCPPTATPAAAPDASFSVDSVWAKEHFLSQRSMPSSDESMAGYEEFKCQFQCEGGPQVGPDGGCVAWFIGWDASQKGWACIQYNALIPSEELVEVQSTSNSSLTHGSAFNRICAS